MRPLDVVLSITSATNSLFLNSFDKLWDSGYNLMGVYPLRNIGWMKNRITTGLKFIIGAFRMTFNKRICEKCICVVFMQRSGYRKNIV